MIRYLQNLCNYYGIDGNLIIYRPIENKKQLLAKWVIENGLKNGDIKKEQPVAEITAGNFGIALAEQCQNLNSKLYLVPLGVFNKHIIQKLSSYNNVEIIHSKNCRDIKELQKTLNDVIQQTGAYSFNQFSNNKQVDFYKTLLGHELDNIKIDAVFEKVGTGATLQAIKEILYDSNSNTNFFISKPDARQIETAHMILSLNGVEQTHPVDRTEYINNFEQILQQTENLTNLHYAKLSLFCAVEWLKNNPKKTAFVFIGD